MVICKVCGCEKFEPDLLNLGIWLCVECGQEEELEGVCNADEPETVSEELGGDRLRN